MVIHAQSVVAEGGSSSAICLYATTQTALLVCHSCIDTDTEISPVEQYTTVDKY